MFNEAKRVSSCIHTLRIILTAGPPDGGVWEGIVGKVDMCLWNSKIYRSCHDSDIYVYLYRPIVVYIRRNSVTCYLKVLNLITRYYRLCYVYI